MSADDTAWPEGKTYGELTPAQQERARNEAAAALERELRRNANTIARVLGLDEGRDR